MKSTSSFFIAIFVSHFCFAQGTWTAKANIGGASREAPVGFSIGNYGYVFSGASGFIYYNDLWRYNPVTNTWTQMASLPGAARDAAVGFAISVFGYVGTGSGPSGGLYLNDFWQYNSIKNNWVQKAN